MIRSRIGLGLLIAAGLAGPAGARGAAGPPELRDGDRVVLVGGTLVEREAESGYLEAQLARRHPGRAITVRNLGWSGDTVGGVARTKANPPADGYRALVDHVAALKPTVNVLGYGAVESFDGVAGLPAFAVGLDRLWGDLAKTGARMVVLTPNRQEALGPPLPDPAAHNADIARYADLLRVTAAGRGAGCVDLFAAPAGPRPWTANGIHPTPSGYRAASALIAPALGGLPAEPWRVTIEGDRATAVGAAVDGLAATAAGVTFRLLPAALPEPPDPAPTDAGAGAAEPRRTLRVAGLASGSYRLSIDGRPQQVATAAGWRDGVAIRADAEAEQVEALRARVVRKNSLYFHRWRPQNETYLFGMRKHEQGRNAAELAAFDPQVAAEEAEIVRLSRPVAHAYELARVPEGEVAR